MSTHNICLCEEIRQLSILLVEKKNIWKYDFGHFPLEDFSVFSVCLSFLYHSFLGLTFSLLNYC